MRIEKIKREIDFLGLQFLDADDISITLREPADGTEIYFNLKRNTITCDGGIFDLDIYVFEKLVKLVRDYKQAGDE